MIKRNLMIGNFQYAAECALKNGRIAEAFLIA
jgi:protein transport protein SEC31